MRVIDIRIRGTVQRSTGLKTYTVRVGRRSFKSWRGLDRQHALQLRERLADRYFALASVDTVIVRAVRP